MFAVVCLARPESKRNLFKDRVRFLRSSDSEYKDTKSRQFEVQSSKADGGPLIFLILATHSILAIVFCPCISLCTVLASCCIRTSPSLFRCFFQFFQFFSNCFTPIFFYSGLLLPEFQMFFKVNTINTNQSIKKKSTQSKSITKTTTCFATQC